MHPQRIAMLLLNIAGGVAVLGSYAHGLTTHGDAGAALWGGIPQDWRGPYSACMPVAAVGHLITWTYLNFRVDPQKVPLWPFLVIYLAILIPSALWMPLTFRYLAHPDPALWLGLRAGLGLTGLAALAMIAALLRLRGRGVHHWLSIIGSVGFAVQTTLLDALVWPAFFFSKG